MNEPGILDPKGHSEQKNDGNMNEPKPEDPLKQKNDCNNITK